MNRTAKIIKADERNREATESKGDKISVSEILTRFDELWRIEHAEDLEKLRTKERKAKELREMILALEN